MKHESIQLNLKSRPVHNRTFILRLWREAHPKTSSWRAILEDPSTGERIGFANIELLFSFLIEQSDIDNETSWLYSDRKDL